MSELMWARNRVSELESELKAVREKLFELDNILVEVCGQRNRYKAALEKIAKPALGGKLQQQIAQQALTEEKRR